MEGSGSDDGGICCGPQGQAELVGRRQLQVRVFRAELFDDLSRLPVSRMMKAAVQIIVPGCYFCFGQLRT